MSTATLERPITVAEVAEQPTRYVAGLLFDDRCWKVVLIHKRHGPPAVVGKWNAVIGKAEAGESSLVAMRREFQEETGAFVGLWTHFLVLKGGGWSVDFFHCSSDELQAECRIVTDEQLKVWAMDSLDVRMCVSNLRWIIPMALGHLNDGV